MVSLAATDTRRTYTEAEANLKTYIASRIFRQQIPDRIAICLPWSTRPASRILDPAASDLLHQAVQHVRMIGTPKTLLLDELGSLWIVHIEQLAGANGFELTWRFICQE